MGSIAETFRNLHRLKNSARLSPLLVAAAALSVAIGALVAFASDGWFRSAPQPPPVLVQRQIQQPGTAGEALPTPALRLNIHQRIPDGAEISPGKGSSKISMPRYSPRSPSHSPGPAQMVWQFPDGQIWHRYALPDMVRTVSASPGLHGLVNKVGYTPSKYWHYIRNDNLVREWWRWGNNTVDSLHQGLPTTPGVPPPGCVVYINHLYRYIFIKNIFTTSEFNCATSDVA